VRQPRAAPREPDAAPPGGGGAGRGRPPAAGPRSCAPPSGGRHVGWPPAELAALAAPTVLDLKDEVGPVTVETGVDGAVLAWLTAKGFPAAAAYTAVATLPRDPSLPVAERVRHALAVLRAD
jgi:hypothetical protein